MPDVTPEMSNAVFFDHLESGNSAMIKESQDRIDEFTRYQLREDSFLDRIIPPLPLQANDLDKQLHTDKPMKICSMEPTSPGAMSVPFATLPMSQYISSRKYAVTFSRAVTRKFTKDVIELKTDDMDVRQVISDNAVKDLSAEQDGKLIYACNTILVGPGQVVPQTSTIQWREYGPLTRDNLVESTKIIRETPSNMTAKVALVNHVTVVDVVKWRRDEAGGDLAQDMVINGFSEQKIAGVDWIVTIKKDLVPTNTVYYFGEPKALGKHYTLEDTTMFMKREAFFLEFYAYKSFGAAIGNMANIARADFNVSGASA